MGRTLAFGRVTKEDPGETIRKSGIVGAYGNKSPFGDHFDQLLFEAAGYEYILGSAAQLAADFATITWDQSQQRFEDRDGSEVALDDYDRIAVIGMDTLTDNIIIDNVVGLEIFHIGNTPGQSGDDPKFKMGDQGGGIPWNIWLGSNTKDCKLDLQTDIDFRSILNLTYGSATQASNARYIANQGLNNYIKVNGVEIYNPSRSGEIIKFDSLPANPYLIRMNGQILAWMTNGAAASEAWFRDLNIALSGYRWDGSDFLETQSRFTLPATIAAAPYVFQVNTANRFFTDISSLDTRIHQRTDSNGVSVAETGNFVNTSNIVTFTSLGNVKNGMRISGASARGIPDATGIPGTTILRNINSTAKTAEMYDALTGAAVNATSTGATACTMDNSGAAGGSHDNDYFQNITGNFTHPRWETGLNPLTGAGALVGTDNSGTNQSQIAVGLGLGTAQKLYFDASNSPSARTHDQTQPITSGGYYYYRA